MMNLQDGTKKIILRAVYIIVIVLIIAIIGLFILKYNVEGEQNMPFQLASMLIISNAEGYQEKVNDGFKWDVEVYQYNDIYLNIEKNKNYKETDAIKKIVISNIYIKKPEIGKVQIYRQADNNLQAFNYDKEYEVTDEIEYIGNVKADIPNLKISNQGGSLVFRVVNKTGKRITSNEETFEHSGRLLNQIGVSYRQIKTKISFDLTMVLESENSFKAKIEVEFPTEDIAQQGSSNTEITNMKSVVFKRE